MFNLFGGLFDFNNDGSIDTFEEVAEVALVTSILDDEDAGLDPDDYDF